MSKTLAEEEDKLITESQQKKAAIVALDKDNKRLVDKLEGTKEALVKKFATKRAFTYMNLAFLFWRNTTNAKKASVEILFRVTKAYHVSRTMQAWNSTAKELTVTVKRQNALIPILLNRRLMILRLQIRKWNRKAQLAGLDMIRAQQMNKSRENVRLKGLCGETNQKIADRVFEQVNLFPIQ